MKFRTTRKAIVEGTAPARLVCAGYCDLQYLLRTREPVAYTCGVYGWNFDCYEVNGLTICTGYRGMPGRRANNIREYEKRASAIWDYKNPASYDEKRAASEALLAEFCKQA